MTLPTAKVSKLIYRSPFKCYRSLNNTPLPTIFSARLTFLAYFSDTNSDSLIV